MRICFFINPATVLEAIRSGKELMVEIDEVELAGGGRRIRKIVRVADRPKGGKCNHE